MIQSWYKTTFSLKMGMEKMPNKTGKKSFSKEHTYMWHWWPQERMEKERVQVGKKKESRTVANTLLK